MLVGHTCWGRKSWTKTRSISTDKVLTRQTKKQKCRTKHSEGLDIILWQVGELEAKYWVGSVLPILSLTSYCTEIENVLGTQEREHGKNSA